MIAGSELIAAVDAAFFATRSGLEAWPDPHPDRKPLDDEYSRLTDPAKWRIVGARAEAWLGALVGAGLGVADRNAAVRWRVKPGPQISRTDRVLPVAAGALPLVIARSWLGNVEDAGVVLGVGDPAVGLTPVPDCGCDACDGGSAAELDCLDGYILSIVSGAVRWLTDGAREITVLSHHEWRARGAFARGDVGAVLTNPIGWEQLAGPSWLTVR